MELWSLWKQPEHGCWDNSIVTYHKDDSKIIANDGGEKNKSEHTNNFIEDNVISGVEEIIN